MSKKAKVKTAKIDRSKDDGGGRTLKEVFAKEKPKPVAPKPKAAPFVPAFEDDGKQVTVRWIANDGRNAEFVYNRYHEMKHKTMVDLLRRMYREVRDSCLIKT